ncbi:MAG TPA: protein translocase subunit SecF [Myxococcales bacterium]|nr:protein translocase subunit SecF [Myxococcales bacterium]HAN31587.1 protein translocase subunit SecF [Myxococcales bacterium]
MEFIKPGLTLNFIGRRQVFFGLSATIILTSLISLAVLGFNRGIDFKGGTKIVVAFKGDAKIERSDLRSLLNDFVVKETGADDAGQIEVQDFSAGSGAVGNQKNFLLLTELTSLVSNEKKTELIGKLKAVLKGAQIDVAKEGEDRFFVVLKDKASINETYATIGEVFKKAGYPKFKVASDVQRQIEVNNFRSEQMLAAEEKDISEEVLKQRRDNAAAQMAKDLQSRKDDRYSIAIEEFKTKLETVMKSKYNEAFIRVESSTSVSPSVAGDMLNQGLVAIIYALLGIIIYITMRFDVRYAPGAIIALTHDVLVVVGCFSIAQIKFTMPIIAAVLTIAGYSINDTIVVFDRIRETIEKYPGAPMTAIINHAISNTLSRTILTSVTTLLAVLSIFLLGGGLIRDFAFAMCIGVVVGTYSSIFVASPLFLTLHQIFERRKIDGGRHSSAAIA